MSHPQIGQPVAVRRRLFILALVLGLMGLQVVVAMLAITGCGRGNGSGGQPPAVAQNGATGAPNTLPATSDPGGSAAADQAPAAPKIDPAPVPPAANPTRRDGEDAHPVRRVLVPQGTDLTLSLETTLSTKTNNVGDRFEATVAEPVTVEAMKAVPAGARVSGHIILCEQPGKASGRGRMQLAFDTLTMGGHDYQIGSRSAVFQSRSGAKKDREVIGGGAAAGAVVGGILGGSLGSAAKGAVIGGAAGAGVSLMTRGPQLEFAPGTKIRFSLDQPVEVRVAPAS